MMVITTPELPQFKGCVFCFFLFFSLYEKKFTFGEKRREQERRGGEWREGLGRGEEGCRLMAQRPRGTARESGLF